MSKQSTVLTKKEEDQLKKLQKLFSYWWTDDDTSSYRDRPAANMAVFIETKWSKMTTDTFKLAVVKKMLRWSSLKDEGMGTGNTSIAIPFYSPGGKLCWMTYRKIRSLYYSTPKEYLIQYAGTAKIITLKGNRLDAWLIKAIDRTLKHLTKFQVELLKQPFFKEHLANTAMHKLERIHRPVNVHDYVNYLLHLQEKKKKDE